MDHQKLINLKEAAYLAGMTVPNFCYYLKGDDHPPFMLIAGRKVFNESDVIGWKPTRKTALPHRTTMI